MTDNTPKDTNPGLTPEESEDLFKVLTEFNAKLSEMKSNLDPLKTKVSKSEIQTSKGVSFLEVKYRKTTHEHILFPIPILQFSIIDLLLDYIMNLLIYMMHKLEGKSLSDHQDIIDQLIKDRVIIEKMHPIERKLRYQIDKLLKMATTGTLESEAANPLRFKPNLADLDSADESVDDVSMTSVKTRKKKARAFGGAGLELSDGDDVADDVSSGGVYRPPKLREVAYSEEGEGRTSAEKERERLEKSKKRAAKSSIMSYIKSQYGVAPEEERVVGTDIYEEDNEDTATGEAAIAARRRRERAEYEEEMMTRLDETREEKRRNKKAPKLVDELANLDKFSDILALREEEAGDTFERDFDEENGGGDVSDDDVSRYEKKRRLGGSGRSLSQALNDLKNGKKKRKRAGKDAAEDSDDDMEASGRRRKGKKGKYMKPEDDEISSDDAYAEDIANKKKRQNRNKY